MPEEEGLVRTHRARSSSRRVRSWPLWGAVALLASACVPLQVTPGVSGRVVDEASGEPVADAIVVVRYDARRDELVPERDLLAHREVRTDASGRFQVSQGATTGLSAWPPRGTEARVVGVMKDGYRCARPRRVPSSGRVTLALERADGRDDRRASCRPLAARPSQVPEYQTAWRALYPRNDASGLGPAEPEVAAILSARATFGFGRNCTGPALDLALAPGGTRVAIALETAGRRHIEIVALEPEIETLARLAPPPRESRRLGWVSEEELVLWEPGDLRAPPASPSVDAERDGSTQTIWRGPRAAARASAVSTAVPHGATDRNDAGEARWQGRSFRIRRALDPATGFAAETLRIDSADAGTRIVDLPGEACGPSGQYGRPHFRIDASGARGLDLRLLEGGCRAVAVEFATGTVQVLDSATSQPAVCRDARRVPLSRLRAAMADYVEALESTLEAAGGDPRATFSLNIDPEGRTELQARDYMGGILRLPLAPFPMRTPIRRIDVTGVAGAAAPPASPAKHLLEPL